MRSRGLARTLALSLGLNLGLALVVALAWAGLPPFEGADPIEAKRAVLADPALRAEALGQLRDEVFGIHDAHVDPDVGRVLIPRLEKTSNRGEHVRANITGMREREIELPKPPGRTRVVLLGDSLVFGTKVQVDERLGAHLERQLEARVPDPDALEVLSLGIASWNVWNECAYLERQLGLLQPDLVVQVLTDNDLDDAMGVRGFGAMATFSPSARERGDSLVRSSTLVPGSGRAFPTPLLQGLDHLSRTRRAAAATRIAAMAATLERLDVAYVPLLYAARDAALLRDALLPAALHDRALAVRSAFASDRSNWVAESDRHWGDAGSARLADALAAWVEREHALDLEASGATAQALDERIAAALAPASSLVPSGDEGPAAALDEELVTAELATGEARHVYAGLRAGGVAAPFVDLALAPRDPAAAATLVVSGQALGRPELRGVVLAVAVEGRPVGSFTLPEQGPFEARFALRPAVPEDAGPLFAVALRFDQHVLAGAFLQTLESARLDAVRIE